jgi:hypothetical protein
MWGERRRSCAIYAAEAPADLDPAEGDPELVEPIRDP